MAARRVPELVRCIEDNQPNQPDLDPKGKKHGGNSSKWEHLNTHPNQEKVTSASDFGQCGQNATGISKDKPKSPPLRSEGDKEEANVTPKHINEEDIAILKSQETRDYESASDTSLHKSMGSLSVKSKGNFAKNGLLEQGVILGVVVLGCTAPPVLLLATLGS
ncbi:hypothetical protein V6N11_072164 [Hibiscus sabdariffa]|uniref:Uncharacterized protein n=1 Tax=Hibiscus sabdariffa TaxID=183260 RepID=A0ABR2U2Z0_9ROSI